MTDQFGRSIDYMRISITDRCNLRCRYCMPDGATLTDHKALLTYEEILRIAEQAAALGITKFKITGGEPLVRRDCAKLVSLLKKQSGATQVTMTTNGLMLLSHLQALAEAELDAVNLSLDTLDGDRYRAITGGELFEPRPLLEQCLAHGLTTKINTVLIPENRDELCQIAALAETFPIDVRFIELMPVGAAAAIRSISAVDILPELQELWPDLSAVSERRGNGPAHYYASAKLQGCIGIIDAMSHRFCGQCNRVRLTSTGLLKPCLCYDTATDLRKLLRDGGTNAELRDALSKAIYAKPAAHCFDRLEQVTEQKNMNEIGG